MIAKAGGIHTASEAMKTHPTLAKIHEAACATLMNLTSADANRVPWAIGHTFAFTINLAASGFSVREISCYVCVCL